jgi:hypothetical protein
MAVLKGGGKSIHISKEECLRELIVWLQKFIPSPICFLAKWIVWKCRDHKSSSHSSILAKHLDPMAYSRGISTITKEIPRGTSMLLVHGCRYVIPNRINKGTFWLLPKQETNLLQCHHLNLNDNYPFLHMP